MVTQRLTVSLGPAGAVFRCEGSGGSLPFLQWMRLEGVLTGSGSPARMGTLSRLVDDGAAELQDEAAVRLPAEVVAGLEPGELKGLGLPQRSPFILTLRATGALSDRNFRIALGFLHPDGRPVVQPVRHGPFLRVGETEYTLPLSAFRIAELLVHLNDGPPDIEARLRALGEISNLVGGDVRIDPALSEVRVSVAEAFEIRPFINEAGEPDLDPVLGRWEYEEGTTGEVQRVLRSVLPENRQPLFLEKFRGLSGVKGRYAAGPGAFVIVEERARRALGAVRAVQGKPARARLEFLQNPSAFVREALGDDADDAAVSAVFADEGLSDRVKGIGVWTPVVLPWVTVAPQSWLPPEHFGLRLDGRNVEIPGDRLRELRDLVSQALERGELTVEHAGEKIPATPETLSALDTLLAQAGGPARHAPGEQTVACEGEPLGKPDRLALLVLENFEEVGYTLGAKLRAVASRSLPGSVRTSLLPHQRTSIKWLQDHWECGSPGALLADDMGLGKTLQAMAFLAWVREQSRPDAGHHKPMLVVAPTGLLRNWISEAEQHLEPEALGRPLEAYGDGLRPLRVADPRGRGERAAGAPSLDVDVLREARWVLTTYETLRDYQFSFARVPWAVAVFDEAQKIKNPAAGVTVAALAINADFCLGLTGTPVENRPAELWSLMDRIRPGFLGSLKEFSAEYEGKVGSEAVERLTQLHSRITSGSPPMMMRRLKEDHIPGLPEKRIHTMVVDMPPLQAAAYDEVLDKRGNASILAVLQNLRKVSLHPHLEDMARQRDYIEDSARLRTTFELLEQIRAKGEKVIVFVESLQMQDFLVGAVGARFGLQNPVLVINGSLAGERRKARVDEFQNREGFDVILMSPKAGGVGLTVTAANHVIHLSRWWNPAVEDQCTDRAYRIGQRKAVEVYCPIARHPRVGEHSFDLVLHGLIERKRNSNRKILAPMGITEEDLAGLHQAAVGGAV